MAVEKNWRYYLGIVLLIYSALPYCIGAILLFFHIPLTKLLVIMGGFIVSAELAFFASAVLLGKTVIEAVKAKIKNIFKRRPATSPAPISKARHYTGVALLLLSFLPYFIAEISFFLGYPKTEQGHTNLFLLILSSDLIFIVSLFVLGEEFWERLKKLFEWKNAQ